MFALVSAVPLEQWLRWAAANWIGLFSILAMLAFALLLVVLALAPDSPPDDDAGRDIGRPSKTSRR